MSKIVSIATAVPSYCHKQADIMEFMQKVYAGTDTDNRKLRYLYGQSGIEQRYSVIPDYSREFYGWKFFPHSEGLEPFPSLEQRMTLYNKQAPLLSVDAIRKCIEGVCSHKDITHLITVSCTGMTAPGLDLQIMELMELDRNIFRTSVNFMGCYAAIHALKIADALSKSNEGAKVLVVCTELCTLHFQREPTMDNIASSLLFGDGAAAVLLSGDPVSKGLHLTGFYSEVIPKGKRDMAWELSSTGFLMTLSGYVPELIKADFAAVVQRALQKNRQGESDVAHWCIHPGGKRILHAIEQSMDLDDDALMPSYNVLKEYGNMSSATILFVLKDLLKGGPKGNIFAAAFGPGLTVETFTASL